MEIFDTPPEHIESIFTNLDIVQKSVSSTNLVSHRAQISIDDIMVKQTRADEIRRLC